MRTDSCKLYPSKLNVINQVFMFHSVLTKSNCLPAKVTCCFDSLVDKLQAPSDIGAIHILYLLAFSWVISLVALWLHMLAPILSST